MGKEGVNPACSESGEGHAETGKVRRHRRHVESKEAQEENEVSLQTSSEATPREEIHQAWRGQEVGEAVCRHLGSGKEETREYGG